MNETNNTSIFDDVTKYDNVDKKNVDNEMLGKTSNRTLNKEWNIKIQLNTDIFTELFAFTRELSYNTIFAISEKQFKVYCIDPSTTHMTYISIDKTELSEYVNKDCMSSIMDENNENEINKVNEDNEELLIYVDLDMLDEIMLNNKYPVDIYFDTKEKKTMYIVNSKTIESRRLNDISNKNDKTINTYTMLWNKLVGYISNELMTNITVNHISLNNVLLILEKKKTKKDKSSHGILHIKFNLSEIDFLIENEYKSSSIQMYGDDIINRDTKETYVFLYLDHLVKFKKLKLSNYVTIYVYKKLPFIMETKLGSGKIKVYYIISPIDDS